MSEGVSATMNFDEQRTGRGRVEFTIGGITFTAFKVPRPEVLARWFDSRVEGASDMDVLTEMDALVLGFLPDEAHDTWRELRARREDAISDADLLGVCRWLIEQASGRPTESPSPSTGSPASGNGSSTDASSSPEAAPVG